MYKQLRLGIYKERVMGMPHRDVVTEEGTDEEYRDFLLKSLEEKYCE